MSLCMAALLAGCGDDRSPVQPSANPSASPLPAFTLSGRVVDTAYRPVAGSRVEIVAGPRTGTIDITDEDGKFVMEGLFTNPVTVRASKDGYQPETRIIPPPRIPPPQLVEGGGWEVQFYLAPQGPSADIAGLYTLTMTADRSCTSLPDDLRTRTYTATIAATSRPGFFVARLSDATFYSEPCPPGRAPDSCHYNQLGIGLAGDYASIGGGIVEQLHETAYLVVSGGAAASFAPTEISAPLEGSFLYCPLAPTFNWNDGWVCEADGGQQCDSPSHQLTLRRR
jgi:hypothetical protein